MTVLPLPACAFNCSSDFKLLSMTVFAFLILETMNFIASASVSMFASRISIVFFITCCDEPTARMLAA